MSSQVYSRAVMGLGRFSAFCILMFFMMGIRVNAENNLYDEYFLLKEKSNFSAAETYKSYENLVKKGDSYAKLMCFVVYYEHVSQLKEKGTDAINYLASAARDDIAEAQFFLGFILSDGKLLEIDFELANLWLEKSVNNGYINAAFQLAANLNIEFRSGNLENYDFESKEKQVRHVISILTKYLEEQKDPQVFRLVGALYFYNLENQKQGIRHIWEAHILGDSVASDMIKEFKTFYNSLNSVELEELKGIVGIELLEKIKANYK